MLMSKHRKRIDSIAFTVASYIVILALLAWGYSFVEGRVNPVVTPLVVSGVKESSTRSYEMQFDGTAYKLRECIWIDTEWYIGQRGASSVRTTGGYSGPPKVNSEGWIRWRNQYVRMAEGELIGNSYADVLHQCPWQPWVTRTPFYTATGEPT